MGRLFKATYRDRKGRSRESSKWYAEFRDHNETIRRVPTFTSKAAAGEFARNVEKLVGFHRASGGQMDPNLGPWLETLPTAIKTKLVEIGLLDGRRVAIAKTLSNHLDDFAASLKAKGDKPEHVKLVTGRARRIIEGCDFRFWSDLSASRVATYLHERRQKEKRFGAQTSNFYLQVIKHFCSWMIRDRRASENPFAHLGSVNINTDRRHDRRALSVEEMRRLLDEVHNGPDRSGRTWHMTGPERAMLYRVAMETGFRSSELRSLTRSSFDLDGDPPTVTVEAAYSKRGRRDTLPLRIDLADALKPFLAHLTPSATVFKMPRKEHVMRYLLRPDLELTGITYVDDVGRYADFHAMRHSFITNLGRSGAHAKTAQDLARHSTPMLTARYTHGFKGDEVAAVNALPDLSHPGDKSAAATGTEDISAHDSVLASCLAHQQRPRETLVGAGGHKRHLPNAPPQMQKSQKTPRKTGFPAEINGEGGIRTHGDTKVPHRFSRPAP